MGNHADRQSNTLNMGAIALKTERATFFEDVFVGQKRRPESAVQRGSTLEFRLSQVPLQPVIKSIALRPPDRDREVESIQRSIDRHDGQSPRWFVKQWDENISLDSEHDPQVRSFSEPP